MENNSEIVKKSKITLEIGLDKDKMPSVIEWQAEDSDTEGMQEAKAMLLSLWDNKDQNALRIDLWTRDMSVEEMNLFFFQTLATLGDTYQRATDNQELANDIREFAHHFAHLSEVFREGEQE